MKKRIFPDRKGWAKMLVEEGEKFSFLCNETLVSKGHCDL